MRMSKTRGKHRLFLVPVPRIGTPLKDITDFLSTLLRRAWIAEVVHRRMIAEGNIDKPNHIEDIGIAVTIDIGRVVRAQRICVGDVGIVAESDGVTNAVSERFISRASACMVSLERPSALGNTASGLPANGVSVNTSS